MKRVLPDIIAWILGLGIAWFFHWQTRDLVWSLWLCSLVLGYLTILSIVSAGACFGLAIISHGEFKPGQQLPVLLGGTAFLLFILLFFSFHFCGFHAVHSAFLAQFFPLAGISKDGFASAFMNPFHLLATACRQLVPVYGMFLLPAIIAERRNIFQPLVSAIATSRSIAQQDGGLPNLQGSLKGNNNLVGSAISRPYRNVVRMHLLIFFFAFSHFMKIDSFLVYAVVYSVYFFPWSELKRPA